MCCVILLNIKKNIGQRSKPKMRYLNTKDQCVRSHIYTLMFASVHISIYAYNALNY